MNVCVTTVQTSVVECTGTHAVISRVKIAWIFLKTYNTYFTMDELLDSLAKSSDSAVGPDDIHYQMLKHLPSDALQSLLNTVNDIWLTGNFPPSWRQSHIVPIPKAGKDSSDPSNYRPIARTSCVCTRHVQLQEHVEHQHQSCMAAHYMIIVTCKWFKEKALRRDVCKIT